MTCKVLKNTIWFPENLILNKYLELLEVQKEKGGGGTAEGGGVQAGNEREGAAVWEVGESVRVSILTTAILSCLSQFWTAYWTM